jgi:hypothetical protein
MSITRTDGASGAYFEIGLTGTLNLSDGTNVLSISPSTGWTPPAGATVFADVSAMASGAADIVIRDNVADALTVRQGSTAYITFRTTNDAEAIILGKPTLFTAMDITMSASPHSLVYGTAGANQTKIVGNVATVNAGAASRVLRLPPTADSAGYEIRIYNVGSDAFEVASSTGSTIVAAVASSKGVVLACNGSGWGQILSA